MENLYSVLSRLFHSNANHPKTDERQNLVGAVTRFHTWANGIYGKPGEKAIAPNELRKNLETIFNPNVTHLLNGEMVATSVNDLFQRFSLLGKKYDSVTVALPYDEVSVDTDAHKVAIRYHIDFKLKDGNSKQIQALSLFKVENNRLSEFNEVSTTKVDHLHS